MKKDSKIEIRIDTLLKEKFQAVAKNKNITVSKYLLEYIMKEVCIWEENMKQFQEPDIIFELLQRRLLQGEKKDLLNVSVIVEILLM